jgi:hypothetical protein
MQITAKVYWCKFDKLVDKYRPGQGKEWSIEAANLSKDTRLLLKSAGVLGRVKNKMDDRDDFLHFSVSEYQRPRKTYADGKYDLWDFDEGDLQAAFDAGFTAKKNDPVPIFKADGRTLWDFKTDGLIGNESVADFKFNVSAPNVYLVAVRIKEHVKYEGAATNNEDPNDWDESSEVVSKKASSPLGDDFMDDDIPL